MVTCGRSKDRSSSHAWTMWVGGQLQLDCTGLDQTKREAGRQADRQTDSSGEDVVGRWSVVEAEIGRW